MGDRVSEAAARIAVLNARRSALLAELEKLNAEMGAAAAEMAGVVEAHPERANGATHAHTVGSNGSNGANGHAVPIVATPAPAPTPRERGQLAERKMRLLALLRDKPEAGLAHLAIRMYGNEGRAARTNVVEFCTDLQANGYIEPGSRPDTFRLTEKGRAMCS